MECSTPPPLTDEALSLVLDDMADDDTRRHLAQCPACAARLADMGQLDTFLGGRLKRFRCPSPGRLGDYHAGMLDDDEAEAIRQHVATCPRCQDELGQLEAFLNLEPHMPSATNIIPLWTPLNVFRARHVETVGSLALKGLGRADDETPHDAKAGTASVFLESTASPTGFVLKGQVLDPEVDWAGAVAEIRVGGATQQVSILDDMAEFRFDLTAGSFELLITAASGITLVVENVTIQT